MSHKARFLRWFRVVPLLLVAVAGMLALATVVTSSAPLRRYLYPVDHRDAILASSARHGVDPALACAVIKCESNWDATVRSGAGAVGLMQLMPDTAATIAAMGVVPAGYDATNLTDPPTNIEFGCAYLGYLQANLASRDQVIAAYNAGIGTVQSWLSGAGVGASIDVADVISYPETSLYLVRVNAAYEQYHSLYDSELNAI